jgi:hypothetical protein
MDPIGVLKSDSPGERAENPFSARASLSLSERAKK